MSSPLHTIGIFQNEYSNLSYVFTVVGKPDDGFGDFLAGPSIGNQSQAMVQTEVPDQSTTSTQQQQPVANAQPVTMPTSTAPADTKKG